jgi:anaerobic magnesium-protoporphyrin IX monomethyl ester cyclase
MMSKKKALLLYPSAMSEVPHSLAMISAVFKEYDYDVKVHINTFKKRLDNNDFMRLTREYNPDIVGISMLTMQVLKTYDLIGSLKNEGYNVIVGGTHATCCAKETLEHGADIAVRNEGEYTLREILQGKELKDILGISYRENGVIYENEPRPRIRDLSTLPDPDFSGFDLALFDYDGAPKGLNRIYTSRGCPGRCTFCDYQVFGQRVAYMPIDRVLKDIQKRIDLYGITKFIVADDNFTTNRRHVTAFCEGIKKMGVEWQAWTRADFVKPEMLKMMKDAGCYMVVFGVESGDAETLMRTRKGTTVEQNINAPIMAYEAGLQVGVNLMFGFPWETVKSLDNNLDYIKRVWDYVHLFNGSGSLVPFPGTEIYRQYVEKCGFENYWLNPRYQDCGVSLYQNAENPYAVSTLSQRFMYDDTYVQEEYFFKYSDEFAKKLSDVSYEIGRHNLQTMFPNRWLKQKLFIWMCKLSRFIYKYFPNLEKGIGKHLIPKKRPAIEEKRFRVRGMVTK